MLQIKKLLPKKYWLATLVLFIFFVGLAVLPSTSSVEKQPAALPATVIMREALATDRGVQVSWLRAVAGERPISGYVVERSHAGSDFEPIGRTEGVDGLAYLDPQGKTGDTYRVIAEDTIAARSIPGAPIVAADALAGNEVVVAPPTSTPYILGTSTVDRSSPPDTQAASLQALAARALDNLETVLDKNTNDERVASLLVAAQEYYRRILTLFPQLSSEKKRSLAQECVRQTARLEASMAALPEKNQMDGLMVVASCRAVEKAAE